jgi:hypothetical protein
MVSSIPETVKISFTIIQRKEELDMILRHEVIFLLLITGILILVIPFIHQSSMGQPSKDYFSLSCNNITSQVNQLLESKGPVQRNMLDLKNMTFLLNLYNIQCS